MTWTTTSVNTTVKQAVVSDCEHWLYYTPLCVHSSLQVILRGYKVAKLYVMDQNLIDLVIDLAEHIKHLVKQL